MRVLPDTCLNVSTAVGYSYFWSVFDIVNIASLCSLTTNQIGDEGAIGLGKGIEKNTTLTELVCVLSNRPKPPDSISRPRWATLIFGMFLISSTLRLFAAWATTRSETRARSGLARPSRRTPA